MQTIAYEGWKGAYRLDNANLEVVVVPSIGRIVHIGLRNRPNMLRLDPGLKGKKIPGDVSWSNFGGDWFWPMAQSQWKRLAESDWPPPEAVGDAPWKAEAWINMDGSQSCLLMRGFGDPIHTWASRLITLDARLPRMQIRQRMLRVGPSAEPVTLWSITQVARPDRIFLPADASAQAGYKPLLFDPPPETHLARCNGTLIYDATRPGQYKIGSVVSNAWIAAQKGNTVIIEHVLNPGELEDYPDGGCAVEMYADSASGYAEIETLSPEVILQTGETLENTVVVECQPLSAALGPCLAATKLRDLLAKPLRQPVTSSEHRLERHRR